MERLTKRNYCGEAILVTSDVCDRCDETIWTLNDTGKGNPIDRLCQYEETGLEPEKLKEIDKLYLAKCEEVNRLKAELGQSVKLPCKVGDTVYRVNNKIINMEVEGILLKNSNSGSLIRIDCAESKFKGEFSYIVDSISNDLGKRVFLTREEAKAKLEERDGE